MEKLAPEIHALNRPPPNKWANTSLACRSLRGALSECFIQEALVGRPREKHMWTGWGTERDAKLRPFCR